MIENVEFPKKEKPKFEEPKIEAPVLESENKIEIINNYQRKRSELLKDIITSKTADNLANYIPGIDVVKLSIEGFLGKTISDKELAVKERFLYVLTSALMLGAYVTGDLSLRVGASATFNAIVVPQLFSSFVEKVSNKSPKLAILLDKGRDFILNNKNRAQAMFDEIVSANNIPQVE